jgi:hypothetical protein
VIIDDSQDYMIQELWDVRHDEKHKMFRDGSIKLEWNFWFLKAMGHPASTGGDLSSPLHPPLEGPPFGLETSLPVCAGSCDWSPAYKQAYYSNPQTY